MRSESPAPSSAEFSNWLPTVSRDFTWSWPHLKLLQQELQRLTMSKAGRLMVFMPPRHGKSECATVRYPVFRLEQDPETRVIVAAYSQTLANRFSRKMRFLLKSRPETRALLSRERYAVEEWETTGGGGVRAVGVGGGITGMGANLIVIDDPVKSREQAESAAFRERTWEWYTDDLYTRLEPDGSIVLILTRWHDDDLAGRILASEEGPRWRVVRLPAFAETREERDHWACRWKRPREEQEPVGRDPGQPLCPDRYDTAALERIRRVLGKGFHALYQQDPQPASGALFRREWFVIVERPPAGLRWARFWDFAAKAAERNDYTAGALVGRSPGGEWYIADLVRGRWEYPEAKRVLLQTAARDGPEVEIGIEDTGSGTAILQDLLRDHRIGGHRLRGVRAVGDKAVRAGAWASLAEGGLVRLLRGAWNGDFLDECERFPMGSHDDQIDAVSGAHAMLVRRGGLNLL